MFGYIQKELKRKPTEEKCANETIGHVNKRIQSEITLMNGKELESFNVTRT